MWGGCRQRCDVPPPRVGTCPPVPAPPITPPVCPQWPWGARPPLGRSPAPSLCSVPCPSPCCPWRGGGSLPPPSAGGLWGPLRSPVAEPGLPPAFVSRARCAPWFPRAPRRTAGALQEDFPRTPPRPVMGGASGFPEPAVAPGHGAGAPAPPAPPQRPRWGGDPHAAPLHPGAGGHPEPGEPPAPSPGEAAGAAGGGDLGALGAPWHPHGTHPAPTQGAGSDPTSPQVSPALRCQRGGGRGPGGVARGHGLGLGLRQRGISGAGSS